MPELLLEVGCEELPASAVRRAYSELLTAVSAALSADELLQGSGVALGTPRRLIISIPGILDRQEDSIKETRGPALKSAFDLNGNPTPALLGFCRGQGVAVDDLKKDEQYVWASKHVPGQTALERLQVILPAAIRSLTFDKTMRWGASRMRFARPIRWLVATLDDEVIPFEIEGVISGNTSLGHRFYAPEPFTVGRFDTFLGQLRSRNVEPDPELRRARIIEGINTVASGTPVVTDVLVDENVFLTEWPTAVQGAFKESFQELPEPVLITAMAKHEKMFPVRASDGKLTQNFVFIRNSGEDDTVRRGTEWVLNARFNDAKFFFDEDSKSQLADFLEKTEGIVFQEKLGSVRSRAERLALLAEGVAIMTGARAEEAQFARQAALYAKADLASGLVSELNSLQGIVGGEYAAREGMAPEICAAIKTQYDLSKVGDPSLSAAARTSLRVIIADQLDKLAGYLGLGLEPTGSSDPFGLRRAVTYLIEAAWLWPGAMPAYDQLFELALKQYEEQGLALNESGAYAALTDIFAGRYTTLLSEYRHDILEAALLREHRWEVTMPQGVRFRAEVLEQLSPLTDFLQTASRPINIVAAAHKKGIPYAWNDPLSELKTADLNSADGEALFVATKKIEDALMIASRERDSAGLIAGLQSLTGPVNAFFENTMVMVEDEKVRYARLSLLHAVSLAYLRAGNFSKLVSD